MDHQVNNPAPNNRPAVIVERQPFTDQLRAFFRRNALVFLVVALILANRPRPSSAPTASLAMHRSQHEGATSCQSEIQQMNTENQKLQDNVKDLQSRSGRPMEKRAKTAKVWAWAAAAS